MSDRRSAERDKIARSNNYGLPRALRLVLAEAKDDGRA